jgi:hypothetical protein
MDNETLYLFVEGDDDQRLIQRLFSLANNQKFFIKPIQYCSTKPSKTNDFIRSIKSTPSWRYLFFTDIDESPCITSKKEKILEKYPELEDDHIIIVIREIESWYLSGITENHCRTLKLPLRATDNITKEMFLKHVPKRYTPLQFKLILLENFCIDIAPERNKSIRYFLSNHLF